MKNLPKQSLFISNVPIKSLQSPFAVNMIYSLLKSAG